MVSGLLSASSPLELIILRCLLMATLLGMGARIVGAFCDPAAVAARRGWFVQISVPRPSGRWGLSLGHGLFARLRFRPPDSFSRSQARHPMTRSAPMNSRAHLAQAAAAARGLAEARASAKDAPGLDADGNIYDSTRLPPRTSRRRFAELCRSNVIPGRRSRGHSMRSNRCSARIPPTGRERQ